MPAHTKETYEVMTAGFKGSIHTATSLLAKLCILFETVMLKLAPHGMCKPVPLCYSEGRTGLPPCSTLLL